MLRRTTAIAASLLAGVLVATPGAAPAAAGATPRPGGLIAFIRTTITDPCCAHDLYTVRSNGQGLRQLTHGDQVTSFAWGPHGRHLLFAGARGIWIMRWDGSHRTLLVRHHPGAGDPVWSPDGRTFAFLARRLWIYTFATHRVIPVDHPATGDYDGVSWSPNSRGFVFAAGDSNQRYQLWHATTATGSVRRLSDFRRGEQGSGAVSPVWSPGGGRIVFLLRVYQDDQETESTNLWSIRPDATHLHQITFSPRHGEHEASWAPKGYRFVDASSTGGDYSEPSCYTALVVRRPDGTTIRRIHAPGDALPNWSPNGPWIVATRPTYGTLGGHTAKEPGLWVLRADGTDAHRILKSRLLADNVPAQWEPDPSAVGGQ